MPKRLTDTGLWDKEWFMELSCKHKCLIRFLFDKADNAGVWTPNWKLATAHIGESVSATDLDSLPEDQYEILENGKIYLPDFINFQYGSLSETSPAHKPVFASIKKNSLTDRVFNRVSHTLQYKDKYKDKAIAMDKDIPEKESEEKPIIPEAPKEILPDPLLPEMCGMFLQRFPKYPEDKESDYPALLEISYKIGKTLNLKKEAVTGEKREIISRRWGEIVDFIRGDEWFCKKDIRFLNKHFQALIQGFEGSKPTNSFSEVKKMGPL